MNSRQAKKNLKKQIQKLQSDNDLMRNIISNSPQMQELYDLYNKPLNVIHSPIKFEQYKTCTLVSENDSIDEVKDILWRDFAQALKDNIMYEVKDDIIYDSITNRLMTSITATVFIGRKE